MNTFPLRLSTIPRAPRLWLLRAGWLAALLLVASMFAASLSHAAADIYYYDPQVLLVRPIVPLLLATSAERGERLP